APLFGDSSAKGKPESADSGDSLPQGANQPGAQALPDVATVADSSTDLPSGPTGADHPAQTAARAADASASPFAVLADAGPRTSQSAHALPTTPAADALP